VSHPVPSRAGRRVLFASNWTEDCTSGCGSQTDIKAYVVSLPGSIVATGEPDPPGPGTRLALSLGRIVPSPAVARCAIDFDLTAESAVRLELVDAAGRVVRHKELGTLGAGPHHVELERGGRLAPGVYWVRLSAGAAGATGRVVFVG
jgi:hypothetical protein